MRKVSLQGNSYREGLKMSSSRSGRPWTKGKAGVGGGSSGRPLTRGRQRGYYSEIVGAEAVLRIGVSFITLCPSME